MKPAPTEAPTAAPTEKSSVALLDSSDGIVINMSSNNEGDAKESTFSAVKLHVKQSTVKSNVLVWTKAPEADGYMLYGNKCGKKNKMIYMKTFKKNTTRWVHNKLKKGTYYKYFMVSYKVVDGKKQVLSISRTIHILTLGGNFTDIKGVKTNKSKITLKKGKTFKLKAVEIRKEKSKKIRRHVKIRYESTNSSIAVINTKGVIKAKRKGKCDIYAYAQNGVYKKIAVKVH